MAKDVDAAVRAAQLYIGCADKVSIKDQQRFYRAMTRKIEAVAKRRNMDPLNAHDQIVDKARSLGGICPTPGKDL